jgi:hypothetical protein
MGPRHLSLSDPTATSALATAPELIPTIIARRKPPLTLGIDRYCYALSALGVWLPMERRGASSSKSNNLGKYCGAGVLARTSGWSMGEDARFTMPSINRRFYSSRIKSPAVEDEFGFGFETIRKKRGASPNQSLFNFQILA